MRDFSLSPCRERRAHTLNNNTQALLAVVKIMSWDKMIMIYYVLLSQINRNFGCQYTSIIISQTFRCIITLKHTIKRIHIRDWQYAAEGGHLYQYCISVPITSIILHGRLLLLFFCSSWLWLIRKVFICSIPMLKRVYIKLQSRLRFAARRPPTTQYL